jgi:Undecaprenyl-phosphate glucose phosphotransferase
MVQKSGEKAVELSGSFADRVRWASDIGQRRKLPVLAEELASHPFRPSYSVNVVAGFVAMAEFAVILLIGIAVHAFYLQGGVFVPLPYSAMLIGGAVGLVAANKVTGGYELASLRTPALTLLRTLALWTVVVFACVVAMFLAKVSQDVSRVWLTAWYVLGLFGLMAVRLAVFFPIRGLMSAGRFDRRTALVGGGQSAEALVRALDAEEHRDVQIVGIFDDRDEDRSPDMVGGYPKLGNTDDLIEFVRRTHLDLVIFTLPISAEERILEMLRKLWVLPVDIRLAAHQSKLRLRPRSYSFIGSVPVLPVSDRPIADWAVVNKWLFDKIVGSLLLVLLSPLMLLTALAVKLDSRGPTFFKQKRYGFNNDVIEVWKFRSMYHEQADPLATRLVTRNDPRVTRVGRFIRKTSLDELPQLINVVFKGNLSLVGPRPHAVNAGTHDRRYDDIIDGYFARHRVKPGITGWAQIRGWRGETDTVEKIQRRVEHDLYYIENWSVIFDLYILMMTPFALTQTENAY